MQNANINANDIGYLNLHGTASWHNDKMESIVVKNLLPNVYCSSTKPLTGHTLGAAGAQELALCWLLLSAYNPQKQLPEQIWDQQRDPQLGNINLVTQATQWEKPLFMSINFAFGGSNVCLIIQKEML